MADKAQPTLLLELGECVDSAEGAGTQGKWGKKHLIDDNGTLSMPLRQSSVDPKQLLPVMSAGWGVVTTGVRTDQQSGSKVSQRLIPLTLTLFPGKLPIIEFIENFLGAGDFQNRINAKLYYYSSSAMKGAQEWHHQRTAILTNGYIQSIMYSFGGEEDSISLSLVGTNKRTIMYDPDGGVMDDSTICSYDPKQTGKDPINHAV